MRSPGLAVLAVLAAVAVFAPSCLSRPSLERQRFSLTLPPPAAAPASGRVVLAIPLVSVAAAQDRTSFVYRTGENSYETDPYAQWLAPPRELVGDVLRANARASGLFFDVTRRADTATLVMSVQVTELCGDFRRAGAPAARVALSVAVARAGPKAPEPVLAKGYERSVPIDGQRPAALAAGLDRALEEISRAIVVDLSAAGLVP